MSKHFIRIFGIFLASGIIAVSGEMEINLVRNPKFRPGMDQQGPAVVIRRNSSPVPRVRAYWRLDALPEKEAEL